MFCLFFGSPSNKFRDSRSADLLQAICCFCSQTGSQTTFTGTRCGSPHWIEMQADFAFFSQSMKGLRVNLALHILVSSIRLVPALFSSVVSLQLSAILLEDSNSETCRLIALLSLRNLQAQQ